MRLRRAAATGSALAVGALGALSAPALAARVTLEGNEMVVRASAGEANFLELGATRRSIELTDSGPRLTAGPGCHRTGGIVACRRNRVAQLLILAGNRDDSVVVHGIDVPTRIMGGDGNDRLVGGEEADVIDGGAGDDQITTGGGDNRALGGDGTDRITGGDGTDWLRGEAGDDTLIPGRGGAIVDGGDGIDTVSFAGATASVSVSLDGMPNDGQRDVGDDVLPTVEAVVGGSGDDHLTSVGLEPKVVLDGGSGADELTGGPGEDVLVGGPGQDVVAGNGGFDHINTLDGEVDRISCGADPVQFRGDAADVLAAGCHATTFPQANFVIPRPPQLQHTKMQVTRPPLRSAYVLARPVGSGQGSVSLSLRLFDQHHRVVASKHMRLAINLWTRVRMRVPRSARSGKALEPGLTATRR